MLLVLEVVGVENCFVLVVVLIWVDKVGCVFVVEDWIVLDFVDVDGDFVLFSCVVFFLIEVVWFLVDCCVFVDILVLEVGDIVVVLWEVVCFIEVGIVFECVEVVEFLWMVGWVLVVVCVLFIVVDFFVIVVFLVDDVLGDIVCLVDVVFFIDVVLDLIDVFLIECLKLDVVFWVGDDLVICVCCVFIFVLVYWLYEFIVFILINKVMKFSVIFFIEKNCEIFLIFILIFFMNY